MKPEYNPKLETGTIGVLAEYDRAKTVIMHTPGEEIFMGTLQPVAALYEKKFIDRYKVAKQHENYISTLRGKGVKVMTVKEVLLEGTLDKENKKIRGKNLNDLADFAEKSLNVSYSSTIPKDKQKDMKTYQKKCIKALPPEEMVRIILDRPSISIANSSQNTEFIAESYTVNPLMNMHFLRDQQITTDKGIFLGKMNSEQRRLETEVTKYLFNKLGAPIVGEVTGDGRLEGGDFIPCGDYAFIGQGLRTNEEGVKQLLESKALGYKEIAVVKDSYKQQDEMHLDTYFNIAGPKKAVILEDRIDHYDVYGRPVEADPRKKTTVEVYKLVSGQYKKEESIPFQDYLARKGFNAKDKSLIGLTKTEQENYGCNFLTIDENEIIAAAIKKTRPELNYINKLREAGIKVTAIPFDEFVKTYGAPHCATQVINRLNWDKEIARYLSRA